MISYKEARHQLEQTAQAIRSQIKRDRVDLISYLDCVGRTAFEAVQATTDFPAFAASAMDGFAISSHQTQTASSTHPVSFEILGTIVAGQNSQDLRTPPGTTWKIMTGAMLPDDCDACLRVEEASHEPVEALPDFTDVSHESAEASQDSQVFGIINEINLFEKVSSDARSSFAKFRNRIWVTQKISADRDVRRKGEDFRVGQTLFVPDHQFRSEDILVLATHGIDHLRVHASLRIAVVSTGDELVEVHAKPQGAQVRNSTLPFLTVSLKQMGYHVSVIGTASDQTAALVKILRRAKDERFDLILTTGGVSVGQCDHVAQSAKSAGATIYFQKVKIRPGKPVLFGLFENGTPLLCLPGNPIATLVAFRFFAQPFLRALQNIQTPISDSGWFRLAAPYYKKSDGTEFLKARCKKSPEVNGVEDSGAKSGVNSTATLAASRAASRAASGPVVEPLAQQQASLLHPLVESHGWIELPDGNAGEIAAGTPVKFHPFGLRFLEAT